LLAPDLVAATTSCECFCQFVELRGRRSNEFDGELESVQGKGVGAAILNKAEGICRDKGVNVIWCDSREVAWDFYLKQGYKCYSQTGFG